MVQRKKITFRKNIISPVIKEIKAKKSPDLALPLARKVIRKVGKKNIRIPRVISIPKQGGFLIPLISGLAALGGLIGGAANVAKVVDEVKSAKKQLSEAERHNKTMEAIAIGKKGSGLYVKRYRKGYGLFIEKKKLQKYQKNR